MSIKDLQRRLAKPFKVKTKPLSGGERGNLQTVRFMVSEVRKNSRHPYIRQKAIEIVANSGISSHDEVGEAQAIGSWVQKKVRYLKDPNGTEYLMHPLTLLDQISIGRGMGDCDDMSLLIATLLLAIGHDPVFRTVRYYRSDGPYDHIYVVDYVRDYRSKKRVRIPIDAIVKDQPIGHEISHVNGAEFEI